MSHVLELTEVKAAIAELTDEEYEEYQGLSDYEKYEYLEPWFSDADTVERSIEEV